jgi:hypothetical protein
MYAPASRFLYTAEAYAEVLVIQSKSVPRLAPLSSGATLLQGPGQSAACEPFGQTALKRADADPDLPHEVALADLQRVVVERVKVNG